MSTSPSAWINQPLDLGVANGILAPIDPHKVAVYNNLWRINSWGESVPTGRQPRFSHAVMTALIVVTLVIAIGTLTTAISGRFGQVEGVITGISGIPDGDPDDD